MMKTDHLIYMNNAATSWPKPNIVSQAVADALLQPPGSMHRGGLESFDVFAEVRMYLAALLGVSNPNQIALGSNATWGLNLALMGFPFHSGDTVVTTKAEHNSVLRPLYELKQTKDLQIIYLDTDETGRVPLSAWVHAMQHVQPRLAFFTHASNVTGAIHDAAVMTKAAKAAGAAVLIDASQTMGWLDLDAENWGADMVAFTGHKYLLGPQGTGGLWVSKEMLLHPHLVGGTGIHSDSDTMPADMPLHLEAGTGNEPSYHGLLAALKWRKENPMSMESQMEKLVKLRTGLQNAGARIIQPDGLCTPVLSFQIPGETAADVGFILQESYCITCRSGIHCAPKIFSCLPFKESVRLSLSRFTTLEEIDAVIAAVEDIIG
ncbi:MAG: aminotransferase class V-fold PLP-dependent enzyme [Lachnospiraceae bacterium]|nr:aminotransferase class V-fold PLP-dependent enzyme [Lachnospiraceae bacterium]MDD3616678.1 aminotransferase class V-fold PLP-dependent enzyme [Lachnospiraceae bacterium]